MNPKPGPEAKSCHNCTFRHSKCPSIKYYCQKANPQFPNLQKIRQYDNELRRAKADAKKREREERRRRKQQAELNRIRGLHEVIVLDDDKEVIEVDDDEVIELD